MRVAGPAANRSTQQNGLSSSLKLMTPLSILSLRTSSPSRYRYSDVSSSQAWAQPPGNLLCRQRGLGVGFEVRAARDQVEVRHVRAVAVEQDDLLEAVVGQRFGDVEDLVD